MIPSILEPFIPGPDPDPDLAERITELVNTVYAVSEAGLWAPGTLRTSVESVSRLLAARQIVAARRDGRLAGSVRVAAVDATTGELGMLACDLAQRGRGIGTALMGFAEDHARTLGLRAMQLDLLMPLDGPHPGKERLYAWYERLGYQVTGSHDIAEVHPDLVSILARPCRVVLFRKQLEAGA